MHPSIEALRNALAYASFSNADVHDAAHNLLTELGTDLEEADYEAGSKVDQRVSELEDALNKVDSDNEDVDAAIAGAEAGDDDDEDEPETK